MMEKIHNLKKRMPLIIGRDDEKKWVDPDLDPEEIKNLIRPFPGEQMTAYTVSNKINSARNERNAPEAIERVAYQELENV
jgi:putative SOS response-associated peptidase YedK